MTNKCNANTIISVFLSALLVLGICIYGKNYLKDISRPSDSHKLTDIENFSNYMEKFKKNYDSNEYFRRLKIYKNSTLEIIRLNKLENSLNVESAVYGHSKYSDWSEEEFAKVMLTKMMSSCKKSSRRSFSSYEELNIPKMMDWRQKGVVGPILDQKMCSGCWAISIVGVMETMLAIGLQKNGTMRPLTKLSIQELIDCLKRNDGCRGGKPSTALEYLKKSRLPIVTEEQYPLLLVDQTCKIRGRPNGVLVTDYTDLCNAQEEEMLRLFAKHGTLIAVVNAKFWQHYVGGVIHKGCLGAERYLNHVIQIVGYDLTASTPYYIVKNSWGEDFGDEGYVKIAIGHNVCGIADEISYLNV